MEQGCRRFDANFGLRARSLPDQPAALASCLLDQRVEGSRDQVIPVTLLTP